MQRNRLFRTSLGLAAIILVNGCCHKSCSTRRSWGRSRCEQPVIVSPAPEFTTPTPERYETQNLSPSKP